MIFWVFEISWVTRNDASHITRVAFASDAGSVDSDQDRGGLDVIRLATYVYELGYAINAQGASVLASKRRKATNYSTFVSKHRKALPERTRNSSLLLPRHRKNA